MPKPTKQMLFLLDCICSQAHSHKEMHKLLQILLSPSELKDLQDRIGILNGLSEGQTQRNIAKQQNVSISKVIRGAAVYRNMKKTIDQLLAKT